MKIIGNLLLKLSLVLRRLGNRILGNKEWRNLIKKWNHLNKDRQFRTNYPNLDSDSTVFDLGGHKGQWSSNIFSSYLSNIYIFEPHPEYAGKIKKRFNKNPKIKVYDFGLSDIKEQVLLSTDEEKSSVFNKVKNGVNIRLEVAEMFFIKEQIDHIDLMKINIEGGEYKLLYHLIETDRISKIKNLQIQFHDFVPNASKLMKDLHQKLSKTHETTYFYEFFWENWKLKE